MILLLLSLFLLLLLMSLLSLLMIARAYGIILGDGCINNKIDSSGYVSMHTIHKSNTL